MCRSPLDVYGVRATRRSASVEKIQPSYSIRRTIGWPLSSKTRVPTWPNIWVRSPFSIAGGPFAPYAEDLEHAQNDPLKPTPEQV